MSHLQCAKIIPASKFDAFNYLANPQTLSEQLKGMIEVRWQNPGVELKTGSEFLFLMSRFGVEQPVRFIVDRLILGNSITYRQLSGVYSRFVHTIKFEERMANETLVTDIVDYEIPFGLIGRLADDFFVRSDLKRILNYRLDRASEIFTNKMKNRNENDVKPEEEVWK